ncbi:hypothetical protein C4J81_07890 [Deltaproteobacteria bacterium Smac51]|nr:hypothetical protein C4J81_07890 [Deltaproteobacteria bacterium Smac51]
MFAVKPGRAGEKISDVARNFLVFPAGWLCQRFVCPWPSGEQNYERLTENFSPALPGLCQRLVGMTVGGFSIMSQSGPGGRGGEISPEGTTIFAPRTGRRFKGKVYILKIAGRPRGGDGAPATGFEAIKAAREAKTTLFA